MRLLLAQQIKRLHTILLYIVPIITVIMMALGSTVSIANASRYAAIVMHADTGKVLHTSSADLYRYPASITKVMTLYMVFSEIKRGNITMKTRLKVSRKATKASPSKLYLAAGSTISVADAVGILITKSANDVAVTVAENIAGSEKEFAKRMTAMAKKIGMKKTTFRNASGLHHRKQRTTARDIAILAQRMYRDFPEYYSKFSMNSYVYKGKRYYNHNKLMRKYKGMEGMKTGFINASGFNLVAVANRHNQRLITVVLGGRTSASRDKEVAKLMNYGFSRLPKLSIVKAPLPRLAENKAQSIGSTQIALVEAPRLLTTKELNISLGTKKSHKNRAKTIKAPNPLSLSFKILPKTQQTLNPEIIEKTEEIEKTKKTPNNKPATIPLQFTLLN